MSLRSLTARSLLALGLVALPALQAGQAPKVPAPPTAPGDHCWRPVPVPVFTSQPGVASHVFKKTAPREALETATLDGGLSLSITHWGCRVVMLTVRMESKAMPDFSKNVAGGYHEAIRQIRHLASLKARTGFNLEKAAQALEAEAKRGKGLAYIRPVAIPGSRLDKVDVQGGGFDKAKGENYLTFEFMRPIPKKHKKAHASK